MLPAPRWRLRCSALVVAGIWLADGLLLCVLGWVLCCAGCFWRPPRPCLCPHEYRKLITHIQQAPHGLWRRSREDSLIHALQVALLLQPAQRHLMHARRAAQRGWGKRGGCVDCSEV